MRSTKEREFQAFVVQRSPALLRTAYLLCGDWALAQDLLQTALARAGLRWPHLHTPEAYVRRTLVTALVDERRRPWRRERPSAQLPETPAPDCIGRFDDRDALRRALIALPPRQRAVVVLRHWEQRSVEEVAEMLGCPPGTVTSLTARGLARLRALLTDAPCTQVTSIHSKGERQ